MSEEEEPTLYYLRVYIHYLLDTARKALDLFLELKDARRRGNSLDRNIAISRLRSALRQVRYYASRALDELEKLEARSQRLDKFLCGGERRGDR